MSRFGHPTGSAETFVCPNFEIRLVRFAATQILDDATARELTGEGEPEPEMNASNVVGSPRICEFWRD